jgi:hypothetical protein
MGLTETLAAVVWNELERAGLGKRHSFAKARGASLQAQFDSPNGINELSGDKLQAGYVGFLPQNSSKIGHASPTPSNQILHGPQFSMEAPVQKGSLPRGLVPLVVGSEIHGGVIEKCTGSEKRLWAALELHSAFSRLQSDREPSAHHVGLRSRPCRRDDLDHGWPPNRLQWQGSLDGKAAKV